MKGINFLKLLGADHDSVTASWFDYGITVGNKHRYFFVETPKVACTTIKNFLRKIEGFSSLENIKNIHYREFSQLKGLSSIKSYSSLDKIYKYYFVFAFVREPLDRVYSAYKSKFVRAQRINDVGEYRYVLPESYRKDLIQMEKKGLYNPGSRLSFQNFLRYISDQKDRERNPHWRLQYNLLGLPYLSYHFIGRQEYFNEDFSYVLRQLSLSSKDEMLLKNTNKTASLSSEKDFVDLDLELFQDAYRLDYELFKKLPIKSEDKPDLTRKNLLQRLFLA